MSDISDSEDTKPKTKPDKSAYPKHLPWKLGDLLPWVNVFYILDYIMILVYIGAIIALSAMDPSESFADALHHLPKDAVQEYYNYPHEDELWSHGREFSFFVGLPLVTFLVSQIWVWSLHDLHNAVLGWGESWVMTSFFTELFKRLFGFLRPNYIYRIQEYDDDDDTEFRDARMTFPSGHAASSMATLFFLTLYLLGKLRPFDEKEGDGFLFIITIVLFPTGLAMYISVTRITEFQHFISVCIQFSMNLSVLNVTYYQNKDVFAGWAIGIFFAYVCYCLLYYPPIWHVFDGRPKPRRSRNIQAVRY